VLVGTGIWLTFAFDASSQNALRLGACAGRSQSSDRLRIRPGPSLAAGVFRRAILVHMGRIFFTGAFRRRASWNWMIGLCMLMLASFTGFTGYSLPNDGFPHGLRIAYSVRSRSR